MSRPAKKGTPVVRLLHFLRPSAVPSDDDVQRMVYELVRERMLRTVGPAGSFAIVMRGAGDDDTLFSETFAEAIAWDVAAQVDPRSTTTARLIA